MSKLIHRSAIEREVVKLRSAVLADVLEHDPNAENAIGFLDPKIAIEGMGYSYQERDDLDAELRLIGTQSTWKRGVCAGLLDRRERVVAVSRKCPRGDAYSAEEMRFTGGHELGHLVLHPGLTHHRDRPIDVQDEKLPIEREADQFAASYLMPKGWVAREVERRFRRNWHEDHVEVDEKLLWWLDRNDQDRFLLPSVDGLALEKAMAICTNAGEEPFVSMKDKFGVSMTAMAWRLRELRLVEKRIWQTGQTGGRPC